MACRVQFLIDRLAGVLERRAAANPHAAASGMVINTMGWVEGLGYELQVHAINAFKASMALCSLCASKWPEGLSKGCSVLFFKSTCG